MKKKKRKKIHVPARAKPETIQKAQELADALEISFASYIEKALSHFNTRMEKEITSASSRLVI